jgi:hypothetical protein|tara:strand:- start:5520 stop:5861 length:342 start_codon:yes stop_codon:yes gene_type:complete
MDFSNLCEKHVRTITQLIHSRVPISVEGMPYARTFVYETIGNRFAENNPLQCDKTYPFTTTAVADLNRNSDGRIKHHPELEKYAFEIVKEVLPFIDTDEVPYHCLHDYIEDCI